jgi:hypothetical protein
MNRNNYSLDVLVNGRPVAEHHKDGKVFVESREGTEYTLRLRNNSWKRILAIFSVDGIEVIKGKAAVESDNGYVLDAFSSVEIKGYRIDETKVAAFRFTNTNQSYSNLVGAATVNPSTGQVEYKRDTKNNGVIGVRVYEEKYVSPPLPIYTQTTTYNWGSLNQLSGIATISNVCVTGGYFPMAGSVTSNYLLTSSLSDPNAAGLISPTSSFTAYNCNVKVGHDDVNQMGVLRCMNMANFVPAQSAVPSFDQGTTWGQKIEDKVRQVSFIKDEAFTDLEIFYASRESLQRYGIDFSQTKQYFAWPTAFEDKKSFCKVPDWYRV